MTHLAALEIGGSNGMVNLVTGSTKYLDLPVVDGDFMGRAYPTGWQSTPNVYDKGDKAEMLLPSAMCSGDGSTVVGHFTFHVAEFGRAAKDGEGTNAEVLLNVVHD